MKTKTAALCFAAICSAGLAGGSGAAEPIRIGLILPYTGVFASIAEDLTRGFMLPVEEFGGKIAGRELQVVRGDSELKPNIALQQLNKLLNSDKVDIVTGGVSSPEAFALREAMVKQQKPYVILMATANALTRELCSPYVARTSFSAYAFESAGGRWLAKNKGKKAFTLAPDYSAGREIIAAFEAGFTEGGGKIVGSEWPAFQKTKDYGPSLAKAKESGADFIYAFFGGAEAIQVVKQHADFGLKKTKPLYGQNWLFDTSLLAAEGDAALDAIFLTPYVADLPHPANRDFVKRYVAKYKADPNTPAVFGYDAAKSILLGLQKTKGDTSDAKALIKAIASVSYESPRGNFRIDPKTHNVINDKLYMARVVKGTDGKLKHQLIEPVPAFADPGTGCKMQ